MNYYLNVLSINDGISSKQLALHNAGIKPHMYYSCERDQVAAGVGDYHFDIVQLGGIDTLNSTRLSYLPKIHLLLINNNQKGTAGDYQDIKRVFEYLKERNPNIKFIYEAEVTMSNKDKETISNLLGIEPFKINTNIVAPHNRYRYYWTNLPCQPFNKRVFHYTLETILEPKVSPKYYLSSRMRKFILTPPKSSKWKHGKIELNPKFAHSLRPSCHKMNRADVDNYVTTHFRPFGKTNVRRLTPLECERLQTLSDDYTEVLESGRKLSDTKRYELIARASAVKIYKQIFWENSKLLMRL